MQFIELFTKGDVLVNAQIFIGASTEIERLGWTSLSWLAARLV